MKKQVFWSIIVLLTIVGMALRWNGIYYVGIDYQECLSTWYAQLKEGGDLYALTEFEGNYNLPYATALLLLTYIPVEPIISIKMLSIVFDFLSAGVLMKVVMECVQEKKEFYGLLTYGLVLCAPFTVINSGYLAQSDGIYVSLALLSFWFIYKDKPVKGMIAFGCALCMKLQAIFALPILALLYWTKKKFSALHLVWIPVTIQTLCIPAIIAGCGWDIAIKVYKNFLGGYPYMYYFYPNVWTYLQGMPYYAFGKMAIFMAMVVLLLYCILVVQSKRKHTLTDYLEYFTWTAMTCAILLPCMHERYNYMAEILIIALSVLRPKMRVSALLLCLLSWQLYIQYFLGGYSVHPYFLAACNIGIYCYLTYVSVKGLWRDFQKNALVESQGILYD